MGWGGRGGRGGQRPIDPQSLFLNSQIRFGGLKWNLSKFRLYESFCVNFKSILCQKAFTKSAVIFWYEFDPHIPHPVRLNNTKKTARSARWATPNYKRCHKFKIGICPGLLTCLGVDYSSLYCVMSTVKIRPDIVFPHCLLFLGLCSTNMASMMYVQQILFILNIK